MPVTRLHHRTDICAYAGLAEHFNPTPERQARTVELRHGRATTVEEIAHGSLCCRDRKIFIFLKHPSELKQLSHPHVLRGEILKKPLPCISI